jgi:hypothetical protein
MWFLALFSTVLCGALLALSAWPGMLEQISAAAIAGVLAIWRLLRPARPNSPQRRTSAIVVLVWAIATPILLTTHTTRWLTFSRHQPQFEALLAKAPPPGNRSTANLNADLGLFWIDQWGTDARGGTYFRTMVGAAPENRSFGFAYRPNTDGSPFGDAGYELRHLQGDWYSFAASDR